MGAVHGRSVNRSTRTVVDRANPSAPRGPPVGQRRGQPRTAGRFCTLTPLFRVNQPTVQPSSKIFLFNRVFFRFETCTFL
jgi:hypothetical protein